MNLRYAFIRLILFVTLMPTFFLSCAKTPLHHIAASWTSEFRMSDYLSEPVEVSQQSDIKLLLGRHWYSKFTVIHSLDDNRASLNSCVDYFSLPYEVISTVPESDYTSFYFLTTMCRISEVILNSGSSKNSYIPDNFLNQSMPEKFPKAMAFQVSSEQKRRDDADSTKKYWADIEKGLLFERVSKNKVRFLGDGGNQTVSLIGRGDYNGDRVEDVLLGVQQSVIGGTYSAFRALIFSVNKQGHWFFVDELK